MMRRVCSLRASLRKMRPMSIERLVSNLMKVGYSRPVAERIATHRPELAENPKPPLRAFRGLSGGPELFDPRGGGEHTNIVLTGELTEAQAIRKAQEFALGVIWGNTRPSADERYTVLAYELHPDLVERTSDRASKARFSRAAVPDETVFLSRQGEFHLREHAPISPIDWHELP